jgi:mRNA-degrading endonuclease RelE of RelBE toxin-antitoxin system
MSYAVVWAPEAEADYARLPALIQSHLLDEIDRLAKDPVSLSIRSHFPYRPDRQMFRVSKQHEDGRSYQLYVLFKYATDEKAIRLTEIAVQVVG